MTIIDADGHVTESQEQLARYLEEPYRQRPQESLDEIRTRADLTEVQKRRVLGENARRLYGLA